jgi:hypothetical protein
VAGAVADFGVEPPETPTPGPTPGPTDG